MNNLRHGAKGQPVLDLQCALASAGAFAGDIDGCFGLATEAAVKSFQSKLGLAITGILDGSTMAALNLHQTSGSTAALIDISAELIGEIFPDAGLADIAHNLPYLLNALVEAGLTSRDLIAMALATVRTEASLFLPVSEKQSNLNTSPGGKPFDLYDHRAMLGNKGAPDGADFRGRGFIQLTGRANYLQSGQAIGFGTRLVSNPLLAHDSAVAGKLLASFLKARQTTLRTALGKSDLIAARRIVNGGSEGLQSFTAAYRQCLRLLPEHLPILSSQRVA